MNKWFNSLTDEGQMALIAIGIIVTFGLITMTACISCALCGLSADIQHICVIFEDVIKGDAGVLGLFLTHSTTGRIFGKPENMTDVVNQKDTN